ncbi:uncharacterized protein BDR25DRAFT_369934 [Lindgomyces ingoldianus]|uniref:Uncharacterized protein n=1 Tax=Lindgomyces ingoldianus TaxID=673940 RepID=A0ACB6QU05_9PLEO|nr:uncharacterized protein BDR25DRAFT_369934 [Lindgomyces ingoldianus]KAF2470005.1 hypothetical protein BDR25DRAFT_369934 [Lindgomyces ingoldianus]
MSAAVFSERSPAGRTRWSHHEWKFVNATGYRVSNTDKNGTSFTARYLLPAGTLAIWKTTYYLPEGNESTDTIRVDGPLDSLNATSGTTATSAIPSKKWKTGCGNDKVIKIRTEVTIESKGAGIPQIRGATGYDSYYRFQQILTYDLEKCD